MGLVPRINTPTNNSRRLYIVAASGMTAAIAIASLVFLTIFYIQNENQFDYNVISIVMLVLNCLLIVSFILQVIFSAFVKKVAEKGVYILLMMIFTEIFILGNLACSIALAVLYNKDKNGIADTNFRQDWNNLTIVSLCLWSIPFIIYIWVTVTFARMYHHAK